MPQNSPTALSAHRAPRSHSGQRPTLRRRAALFVARPFFALAFVVARVLPRRSALSVARACARGAFYLFPGVRSNLLSNAAHLLGAESSAHDRRKLAKGVLESFSRFIMEWVSPRCGPASGELFTRALGKEHLLAALESGSGAIAVTVHMGNYELPARELAAVRDDVAIVFERERVGFLEAARSKRRRDVQLDEIVVDSSPFFSLEIAARLRRGGIVLLAADHVAREPSVTLPFFNSPARLSLWPARLSIASRAPLVPAVCVLNGSDEYVLSVQPPIRPQTHSSAEAMTRELAGVLERFIAAAPDQWLMVHRFWPSPIDASRSATR